MKLEQINVISSRLARPSETELSDLEARLSTRFPAGYREFMTTLGEGMLGTRCVRVYPPWTILDGVTQLAWRERIDEYWNWDLSNTVFDKTKASGCVLLGDSLEGDEFAFHPSDPERIYVIPLTSEVVYVTGPGLLVALDHLSTTTESEDPSAAFNFVSTDSRSQLPYSDGKDALVAALRRDASLHVSARHSELGEDFDDLRLRLPRDARDMAGSLRLALHFWGAWLESVRLDPVVDAKFPEFDWPVLACRIADDLVSDQSIRDVHLIKRLRWPR